MLALEPPGQRVPARSPAEGRKRSPELAGRERRRRRRLRRLVVPRIAGRPRRTPEHLRKAVAPKLLLRNPASPGRVGHHLLRTHGHLPSLCSGPGGSSPITSPTAFRPRPDGVPPAPDDREVGRGVALRHLPGDPLLHLRLGLLGEALKPTDIPRSRMNDEPPHVTSPRRARGRGRRRGSASSPPHPASNHHRNEPPCPWS